jgi:eukaryotic-like serine/threonine-protein kinase
LSSSTSLTPSLDSPRISPALQAPPRLAAGMVPSAAQDAGPTVLTDGGAEPSLTATVVPNLTVTSPSDSGVKFDPYGDTKILDGSAPVPTVALRPIEGARSSSGTPKGPEQARPALAPAQPELRPPSMSSRLWLPRKGSPQRRVLGALAGLVVLLSITTGYLLIRKPATGYVYIELPARARGTARVNINGEDLGQRKDWPLVHKTTAGQVPVLVTVDGFKPFRTTLDVREGAETTPVTVRLEAEVALQKVLFLLQPEEARLKLNGDVVKDEAAQGPYLAEIPAGTVVQVEANANGFRPYKDRFVVRNNTQTQVVNVRLEPEQVEVTILSNPPGAAVSASGRELGTTPTVVHVRGPTVELTFRKKCYVTSKVSLKLEGRATETVNEELKRSPGCSKPSSMP